MLVFVDTNIVIYLIEQPAGFGPRATAYVNAAMAAGDRIVVSDLVRMECRVGPLAASDTATLADTNSFLRPTSWTWSRLLAAYVTGRQRSAPVSVSAARCPAPRRRCRERVQPLPDQRPASARLSRHTDRTLALTWHAKPQRPQPHPSVLFPQAATWSFLIGGTGSLLPERGDVVLRFFAGGHGIATGRLWIIGSAGSSYRPLAVFSRQSRIFTARNLRARRHGQQAARGTQPPSLVWDLATS